MSDERLAEIRGRLNQRPTVVAVGMSDPEKSPVANYLSAMRIDQRDLLAEVDRLKAEVEVLRSGDSPGAASASSGGWARASTRRSVSPIW
jgi:hypothetical protein